MKRFKITKQILPQSLIITALLLLLLFPIMNFKFGLNSNIFPAVEVTIIFYFSSYHQLKYWQIFLAGLFFDQLYCMPLGINSLVFLLAAMGFEPVSKITVIREDITNFIVFCGYALVILLSRAMIMPDKSNGGTMAVIILFQYFTTIFSYPLVKFFFRKFGKYIYPRDFKSWQ